MFYSFMFYVYLFQINVFARPLRILQGMESFEVLGLHLAYVNSVLNPWLYILLRKETVMFLQRFPCMRVLSNQRPRKYHRIGVTLNLFIFMFYVSYNKNKLFIIGYFLIIIIEDMYLNHSNLLVFWTLNSVYVVRLTKFMDYSKLILLHEIGISVTTVQIFNYHESRTYSFDVLKFQY